MRATKVPNNNGYPRSFREKKSRWSETLDAAKVTDSLKLRYRRPGDRFRPLGAPGVRKLKDFLIDAKVPQPERDKLSLVVMGDEIVWVVGCRIADTFKVTAETKTILRLQAMRDNKG